METPEDPPYLDRLAAELKVQIFQELPDLWSAISLRQTCHEMNDIYVRNETRIRSRYRDRIVAAVEDYFTFLTSFYIDEAALDLAPRDGWPDVPSKKTRRPSRDFAWDVARHLPCMSPGNHGDNMRFLEYKCEPQDRLSPCGYDEYLEDVLKAHPTALCQHAIKLTRGYESGGVSMYLDTMTGEIILDIIRMDNVHEGDVVEYFNGLKEKFRTLAYVPIMGEGLRERKEQGDPGEWEGPDLIALYAHWGKFPTSLDIKWICHLYHKFGWPGPDYRKEEALQEIKEYRGMRRY